MNNMIPMQQLRLYNALKKLTNLKDEKLMAQLKKATMSKHLSGGLNT